MQKEIRVIDEKKQIVRITTLNERWYCKPGINKITGIPTTEYFPSSTWIAGHYPKGIAFYKWLADKGWDNAEETKNKAASRGSKIHRAIETLEAQGSLSIDSTFEDYETGVSAILNGDELSAVMSFAKWHADTKPRLIANELTVFGDGYAGTLDKIYEIDGQIWIVDIKTSPSIWPEMKLQLSSYNHAQIDFAGLGITKESWANRKTAILQVGYKLNKKNYKFTEIEDHYELFLAAKLIWSQENNEAKPKEKDFPLTIKLETIK